MSFVEDLRAHREGILAQGFWAIRVHRLASSRQNYKSKIIRVPWFVLNCVLRKIVEVLSGISIGEGALIGRRVQIEHFGQIIIHGNAKIGDDVLIRQGVTIGNKDADRPFEAPIIGDRVQIGAGAKIIGGVVIGSDSIIGANAVVTKDVPPGFVATGVPATCRPRRISS